MCPRRLRPCMCIDLPPLLYEGLPKDAGAVCSARAHYDVIVRMEKGEYEFDTFDAMCDDQGDI